MRYTLILLALLLPFFVGCSITTKGEPLDRDDIQKIVKNKTTKEDIIDYFGDPTEKDMHAQEETFVYVYSKYVDYWNPLSIFPFVEVNSTSSEYQRLHLQIDKGIVVDFKYSEKQEDEDATEIK